MTIQRMSSKGRISIVKIQNFTIERRQSVIPLVYGTLLLVVAVVMATVSPLERITNWVRKSSSFHLIIRLIMHELDGVSRKQSPKTVKQSSFCYCQNILS